MINPNSHRETVTIGKLSKSAIDLLPELYQNIEFLIKEKYVEVDAHSNFLVLRPFFFLYKKLPLTVYEEGSIIIRKDLSKHLEDLLKMRKLLEPLFDEHDV